MAIKHEPIDEVKACVGQGHSPSSYEILNGQVLVGCNTCQKKWTLDRESAAIALPMWVVPAGKRKVLTHVQHAQKKFLGEMRGTGHELDEWSDEDLQELRATATQLAARAAVELVKRSRSAGPTVQE